MMSIRNRSHYIEQVLRETLDEHGFRVIVLTNQEGLPLSAATHEDRMISDVLAAVAPVIERAASQSNTHSGLDPADEVVVQNVDRTKIVCRFFTVDSQKLILACVVPKDKAYRRAMNKMIRNIQKAWSVGSDIR